MDFSIDPGLERIAAEADRVACVRYPRSVQWRLSSGNRPMRCWVTLDSARMKSRR